MQIPPHMSVALNLSRITGLRVALFPGKHVMLRVQILFSTIALLVRIELLCRLPPKRANRVVGFEGIPIQYNTCSSNRF